jgi:hypothetical protein
MTTPTTFVFLPQQVVHHHMHKCIVHSFFFHYSRTQLKLPAWLFCLIPPPPNRCLGRTQTFSGYGGDGFLQTQNLNTLIQMQLFEYLNIKCPTVLYVDKIILNQYDV